MSRLNRDRLNIDRVLRALARFDVAQTSDVAEALQRANASQLRRVWVILQKLVQAGLASREGDRGKQSRYRITDAGRAELAGACRCAPASRCGRCDEPQIKAITGPAIDGATS